MEGADVRALALVAAEVAREWRLELEEPAAGARYSFVAAVGGDAVLKVAPLEDDESAEEADALALWGGDGAVRLLRHDRRRRVLLLERARPGTDLAPVPEEEATAAAVAVAARLWVSAADRGQSPGLSPVRSGRFRVVHEYVPRWPDDAPAGPLAERARELYGRLPKRADTLVHGDLHHQNVLRSQRGWLAIDPKPFLAEPEYDVPPFLWNPLPCRLRVEHLEARLAAFAAAGLDERRMRAWTVIRGAYLQPQEADALLALV